jgi:hypothetical protein
MKQMYGDHQDLILPNIHVISSIFYILFSLVTTQVRLNPGLVWVRGDSILNRACESIHGLVVSSEALAPFTTSRW